MALYMEELSNILEEATTAIGPSYFQLPTDGGERFYRERVYTYELYHQMRQRWPDADETPFSLNGEVDKRAHPGFIALNAAPKIPDLLVHEPGHMHNNYAVIEVKSQRASNDGIRKDLEALSFFVSEFNYQRAVYLIYGDTANATLAHIQDLAEGVEGLVAIEYWAHDAAGKAAQRL